MQNPGGSTEGCRRRKVWTCVRKFTQNMRLIRSYPIAGVGQTGLEFLGCHAKRKKKKHRHMLHLIITLIGTTFSSLFASF